MGDATASSLATGRLPPGPPALFRPCMTDDEPVTRREANQRDALSAERWEEHRRVHEADRIATTLALSSVEEREDMHRLAHAAEHGAHGEKHVSEGNAVTTALDAVNRERTIHAEAHDREHEGHQREHGSGQLAIDKAEQATDKRFTSVNGTRDQMAELIRSLASKDTVDGMALDTTRRWEENRKELDRRFDEQRLAITNIEKGDVKGEGKELGRSTMVAIIVTAVGLVGTILGIVIVISNFATGTP